MATSCTVLICSCDKYQDILPPFFTLFKKYWPNCKYDIAISTETFDYHDKDLKITNLHPANSTCSWTERINDALSKINSDQIFLLCDDFFLYDKVNDVKIKQIVEWLQRTPHIASFTLWPLPYGAKPSPYEGFSLRSKNAKYKVAIIAGLWNKRWLQTYLSGIKESAWEFEPNANQRSYKMLHPGKFYAMLDSQETIFPYDFTKIGLFSGQWLPETKKVFQENHIKIDFSKRGFFDPKNRPLKQSVIDSLCIDSTLLPNQYFKLHKEFLYTPVDSQLKKDNTGIHFEQTYHIKYGKDCFRWIISEQCGFAITNLKIKVYYEDDTIEEVKSKQMSGLFERVDNLLLFNAGTPSYIIVLTPKNCTFHKITISGKIPTSTQKIQQQLIQSYQTSTAPLSTKDNDIIISRHWLESDIVRASNSEILIRPQIHFIDQHKNIIDTQQDPIFVSDKFSYTYPIPKRAIKAFWRPSNEIGFCIKNLTITTISHHRSANTLHPVTDLPQFHNKICYIIPQDFEIDTSGYDSINISGEIIKPIPNRLMRRIIKQ